MHWSFVCALMTLLCLEQYLFPDPSQSLSPFPLSILPLLCFLSNPNLPPNQKVLTLQPLLLNPTLNFKLYYSFSLSHFLPIPLTTCSYSLLLIVSPGIYIPLSQNNCLKFVYIGKPCSIAWRTSWEVWNPTGTTLRVVLTFHFSPSPLTFTCLIFGESYVDWVLRNNSSVSSVAVTGSHSIIIISSSSTTSSPFFILSSERVSLPFLGCHNACFCLGPWLPRVVFQLFL